MSATNFIQDRDIEGDISLILSLPPDILRDMIEEVRKKNELYFETDGIEATKKQLILTGGTYEDMDEEINEIRNFIEESEMRRMFEYPEQKDFFVLMVEHLEKIRDTIKEEGLFIPVQVYLEVGKSLDGPIRPPIYGNISDAGCDVIVVEDITLAPNETVVVPTGFKVAIPIGYEIQVRLRSSVALRTPLRIPNAPGTIDAGYRGEVGVIVWNSSNEPYTITKGTRIAQLILNKVERITWKIVEDINTIDGSREKNGVHGFGSTGE